MKIPYEDKSTNVDRAPSPVTFILFFYSILLRAVNFRVTTGGSAVQPRNSTFLHEYSVGCPTSPSNSIYYKRKPVACQTRFSFIRTVIFFDKYIPFSFLSIHRHNNTLCLPYSVRVLRSPQPIQYINRHHIYTPFYPYFKRLYPVSIYCRIRKIRAFNQRRDRRGKSLNI